MTTTDLRVTEIVRCMATTGGPEIQRAQTAYRLRLADAWQIPIGARVLEIACGQGDMTAVLAHVAGPTGHVTAVDIASPDYGSPITLGEAAAHLRGSALGDRIDIRFEVDLLDPEVTFPAGAFDVVVLAHGAWYFADQEQLRRTLARVRQWGRRLCFAEWDLEPASLDQVPHLLAVMIRGPIEATRSNSDANVRTPLSRDRAIALLGEAGWRVSSNQTIDTSGLQDAEWEISACLHEIAPSLAEFDLSPRHRDWIESQLDLLGALASHRSVVPLPAYALNATPS